MIFPNLPACDASKSSCFNLSWYQYHIRLDGRTPAAGSWQSTQQLWTYHASKVVQCQSDLIFCCWNCNRTHVLSWHVMTPCTTLDLGTCSISQVFILVKDAGAGDADGVYKPASRRWLEHDVYENRFGECIISREAQTSKSGQVKHGSLLAKKNMWQWI